MVVVGVAVIVGGIGNGFVSQLRGTFPIIVVPLQTGLSLSRRNNPFSAFIFNNGSRDLRDGHGS